MKRILCLGILLVLCLGIALPGDASNTFLVDGEATTEAQGNPASSRQDYQQALAMLEEGDLISAINAFAKVGLYEDAPQYTSYLTSTLALLRNDTATAIAGFEALGDFLDSATQLQTARLLGQHRFYDGSHFGYANLQGKVTVAPAFDWAERSFRSESIEADASASPLPVAVVFAGTTTCDGTDILPVDGKYGLLSATGNQVIPLEYDAILWTVDGVAAAQKGDMVHVYSLRTGDRLGDAYEEVGEFSEGLLPVRKGEKWGYLGRDGTLLPGDLCWDSALPFSEGLAGVSQEGLFGFVDATGALALPLAYQGVASFGNGLAGFLEKKKWGFMDTHGNEVIKPTYQAVDVFSLERCAVKRSGKWGIIDLEGTVVLKNRYDEITRFDPMYKRAWMRNNKLWGIVSIDGAVVLKPTWSSFTSFGADGMSCVTYKKKFGYIDVRGVNRIPNVYDMGVPFTAGVAGVRSNDGFVRYLDKLQRGFRLDSAVPTQPLNGFIEARHIQTLHNTVVDTDSGKESVEQTYTMTTTLHDVQGNPIAVATGM